MHLHSWPFRQPPGAVRLSSFNFFSAARGSLPGPKQFDEADPTIARRSAGQEEAVFILQVPAGTGLIGPLPTTRSCCNTQKADNATGTPDPQADSSIRTEGRESGRQTVSQCLVVDRLRQKVSAIELDSDRYSEELGQTTATSSLKSPAHYQFSVNYYSLSKLLIDYFLMNG